MQVLDDGAEAKSHTAPDAPAHRPHYPWWLGLVAAFAVSRVVYARAGVKFDTTTIAKSWQILPPDLLQHHLLQSLWYLHAQPPLLDLIAGIALKLPWSSDASLHVLFVVLGLALAVVVFELAVELGAPLFLAFATTALLICSPSTALYESWFFGTYPTALFLVSVVLFFARTVRTRSPAGALGCTGAMALLVLTRPTYHALIAVVLLVVLMLITRPRAWSRRWSAAIAAPVVLVVALQVKNLVQFQQPTLSSWTGMNLAHMIFRNDADIVRFDEAHGRLSNTALVPPFSALAAYGVTPPRTGVPALDRPTKGNDPNFNNQRYIAISRQYFKDALKFVTHHPGAYAALVADSFRTSFTSPIDYSWIEANRARCTRSPAVSRAFSASVKTRIPSPNCHRPSSHPTPSTSSGSWSSRTWGGAVRRRGARPADPAAVEPRIMAGRPGPRGAVRALRIDGVEPVGTR